MIAPRNLLAVGAHPHDVEYHAGATLAGFILGGARVTLVICSDGERGLGGGSDLAVVRREEARRAAEVLGAAGVVMLSCPDGDVPHGEALRRQIAQEIRRTRPDLVLGHDPSTLWREVGEVVRLGHSDHRAAGTALLDAVPRAASGAYYPEMAEAGLGPWFTREVWLFDTDAPDHFIDVAPGRETKRAALTCHASQLPTRLVHDAEAEAERFVSAQGFPAEAFRRLVLL